MNPTPSRYYAFLGKYHISHQTHDAGQKRVDFKKITVHPNYRHSDSDNDIAMIEVSLNYHQLTTSVESEANG